MKDKNFLQNYLKEVSLKVIPNKETFEKILKIKNILLETKKKRKKVLIFGNGGSAAISSHVSVDLTKNTKIKVFNFNEADLLTCFSNDYGYEKWVEKTIDFYADKGDVVIYIAIYP